MKKIVKYIFTGMALLIGSPFILFFLIPLGCVKLYLWSVNDDWEDFLHFVISLGIAFGVVVVQLLILQYFFPEL